MSYLYHFSGRIKTALGNELYTDGLTATKDRVNTPEAYAELKRIIAAGRATPENPLILLSLTFLEELPDE